jgi:hypothetical protein
VTHEVSSPSCTDDYAYSWAPITYTPIYASHLLQVHDLLERTFWPGIDGMLLETKQFNNSDKSQFRIPSSGSQNSAVLLLHIRSWSLAALSSARLWTLM